MKVIKADVNDDIIFNTIEDIDTGITTGITSVLKLPTGNLNNILIAFNFINKKLPQELKILANFNINEKNCLDVPLESFTIGEKTYENACYIPAEVFVEPCYFLLGLYGFALENENEIKQRISLIPLKNIVVKGSYDPDAKEGIIPTPTAFEVYFNKVADVNKEMQENFDAFNQKIEEKFTEANNLLNEKILFHKKQEEIYITTEENQTIIPIQNYINPSMVFVDINGLTLNLNEFTLDEDNQEIVLSNSIDVIGTEIHIIQIKSTVANIDDYNMLKGELGGYEEYSIFHNVTDDTETDTFELPAQYNTNSIVEVYVNGKKIPDKDHVGNLGYLYYEVKYIDDNYYVVTSQGISAIATDQTVEVIIKNIKAIGNVYSKEETDQLIDNLENQIGNITTVLDIVNGEVI